MQRSAIYLHVASTLMIPRTSSTEYQAVTAALNSERDYQDRRWGQSLSSNRPGAGERSIDEFILYIFGYSEDARQILERERHTAKELLDVIRKIGGLCVACFEQHHMAATTSFSSVCDMPLDAYVWSLFGSAKRAAHTASHLSDPQKKLRAVFDVFQWCFACLMLHGAPLRKG